MTSLGMNKRFAMTDDVEVYVIKGNLVDIVVDMFPATKIAVKHIIIGSINTCRNSALRSLRTNAVTELDIESI
jgi:hypothetical protein